MARYISFTDSYQPDLSRYRLQFLRALRETTPEVLESLRDQVLPVFVSPSLISVVSSFLAWIHSEPDAREVSDTEKALFKTKLDAWAAKHNLGDKWLLETASLTLETWRTD